MKAICNTVGQRDIQKTLGIAKRKEHNTFEYLPMENSTLIT